VAARPKERRVKAAIARRAATAGQTPIDYVCAWLARGGRFPELSQSLALELGESVSRRLASTAAHHLALDADERIAAAQSVGRTSARDAAARLGTTIDQAHRGIGQFLILGITRQAAALAA
jgi:hypothetical protein